MRKLPFYLILALPLILLSSSFPVAIADRGMIPVYPYPDVSIYEPGQKAIIAWNGKEEIMILSTDVHATSDTFVLEIMPLPSNPKKIEKASFESFARLQEFIWRHARKTLAERDVHQGLSGYEIKSVQVTFHERIGAHDITVVNASDTLEFVAWMKDFLESNDVRQEISLEKFEPVIADYMARGFRYFVLDLIEMSVQKKSVEPILYQFETTFLYYPLKISSPIPGDTKITLFTLTNNALYTDSSPYILGFIPRNYGFYPLKIASHKASYSPIRFIYFNLTNGNLGTIGPRAVELFEPIYFNLTKGELSTIDFRIGELFEGDAWLTVLEYDGPLNLLTRDLMIAEGTSLITTHANVEEFPPHIVLYGVFGAVCALLSATLASLIIYVKQSEEEMCANKED